MVMLLSVEKHFRTEQGSGAMVGHWTYEWKVVSSSCIWALLHNCL